ncbi:myeloid zinc finger 1-like isoform X1 [Balaenoptera musculus]|uniref:Myeloid zinc finger 1-like isoform X1 n=1 Tax=Balaenoptera musculus TaxID=9771 RepID=A0A8B8W217_BALMU|nr:myeloid zinc finger 1-like isoform X1 [Balaenoptera musculus]XP_036690911.1 myeloid zinc finger 1-like isoform X1 [Balaenoptera musculus]
MMELLVMEQFLGILLHKLQPRVVAEQPKSCKKAASLVEDLTKALAEPGGPARASEDLEPSKTQAPPRPVSDPPALGYAWWARVCGWERPGESHRAGS